MESNKSLEYAKRKLKSKIPVLIITIGVLVFVAIYSIITTM